MSTKPSVLALLGTLATAMSVRAELPPTVYDKMRSEAGEAVIIQVTEVKVAEGTEKKSVTVEAKVLSVERSKAGLKKGDTINLKYAIPNESKPGPSPVPLLERDRVCPAFLDKKGDGYIPAAGGYTFTMTPFSR